MAFVSSAVCPPPLSSKHFYTVKQSLSLLISYSSFSVFLKKNLISYLNFTCGKFKVSSSKFSGANVKIDPLSGLSSILHYTKVFTDVAPTVLIEYKISGRVDAFSTFYFVQRSLP